MTSFTFNKGKNPITPFFMLTLENYMHQGEELTDQIADTADLIQNRSKELSSEEYQSELEDAHHFLIQAMDEYLSDLNYFKYLGKFERLKILNQQKAYIDVKLPTIKILGTDEEIDCEIYEAVKDVFGALALIRSELSQEMIDEMLGLNMDADAFNESMSSGRFLDIDDMDDRMEFTFWLNFSRRLHFYPLSEQMADYLDEQEKNGCEIIDKIKARLRGREQEMFPAHLCTLDEFDDDDIEMAQHIIAEEDAQDAENELDGDDVIGEPPLRSSRETKEPADITDMFNDGAATPAPSNNNNSKDGGQPAEVIQLDRFRKKPDQPKP